nr:hypothetical protein [Tanacetum cinerariifolium]
MSWFSRCSWCAGPFKCGNCQRCTTVSFEDEIFYNPDSISNDETPDFSYHPTQPQTFSFNQLHCFRHKDSLKEGERCKRCTCKWCGYGLKEGFCWGCASRDGKSSIDVPNPNSFNDSPNEESTIPLNEINSQDPLSLEITSSSVEDLVPIPYESEDRSGSDSECDLPSCDDFFLIKVSERKSETFSNPLFDSNDDFTSSDKESLFDEDVPEENVLEDIESKVSYDFNLDEPTLLVTPFFDANKDECFDPGGNVKLLLHHDPSTPKISVASILEGFTDEPPLEENDDLFDLKFKEN